MVEKFDPVEAFPYKPPSDDIKEKYRHIFQLKAPLKDRFFKRSFDVIVAAVLLLAALPVLLVVKIAYLIEGWLIPENSGSMFFIYNAISAGKIIPKYKIRLIKKRFIDQEGAKRRDWHAFSAEWTSDSRTHVGQFVKRFYLDELPQLFNVLGGSMSLVGPRPHAVAHNEFYKGQIASYMLRHRIKPGLTGLAQVNGFRGETDTLDKMEARVNYDLAYINNWSIWLDIEILFRTVFVLFSKNAY